MEHKGFVFVPTTGMDEDEMQHHEVVDWAVNNTSHPNVLVLTTDDVYYLQYESKVLDIINEENDSMLEMYEDTWVIFQGIRENIQKRLSDYLNTVRGLRLKDLLQKILKLTAISVQTEKGLYFQF